MSKNSLVLWNFKSTRMEKKYNVLLLGSGGREHAIAWKISQSNLLDKLYIAPGNAGTNQTGTNIALNLSDFEEVKEFAICHNISMLVVGPEEPLVNGITDFFNNDEQLKQIAVIGPSKAGALLEGSKDFAKQFMLKLGIPTAAYKTFDVAGLKAAKEFLRTIYPPYVLKADGLAAGKGVVIVDSLKEADDTLDEMLSNLKFGKASNKVVIEEFLKGIELSVFVLTDGFSYLMLPEAKDYKRIGEGDTGLNTGGMGSVSPVPFADKEFLQKVEERIIKPTIYGLKKDAIPYKGFIFFGLINVENEPFVIEYNVRLGDPETESVIPRVKNDLLQLFEAVSEGNLKAFTLDTDSRHCSTVMLVAGGYPGNYEKGNPVSGLARVENSIVFHAGTKESEGKTITNGGRVIAVTSFGSNIFEALQKSYNSIEQIEFKDMYYRKDLGFDLKKVE